MERDGATRQRLNGVREQALVLVDAFTDEGYCCKVAFDLHPGDLREVGDESFEAGAVTDGGFDCSTSETKRTDRSRRLVSIHRKASRKPRT